MLWGVSSSSDVDELISSPSQSASLLLDAAAASSSGRPNGALRSSVRLAEGLASLADIGRRPPGVDLPVPWHAGTPARAARAARWARQAAAQPKPPAAATAALRQHQAAKAKRWSRQAAARPTSASFRACRLVWPLSSPSPSAASSAPSSGRACRFVLPPAFSCSTCLSSSSSPPSRTPNPYAKAVSSTSSRRIHWAR